MAVAVDYQQECQSQLNAHTDELAGSAQCIGINDYANAGSSNIHGFKNNEAVLVHQPPNGICGDDDVLMVDEDGAVSMSSPKLNGNGISTKTLLGSTNTGLSQSDLSLSSSAGSNQGYCYGNQEVYTVESKAYSSTSPRFNSIDVERLILHEPNAEQINDEAFEAELINGNIENSKPIITAAIYKSDSNPVEIGNCIEMEAEVNESKEILAEEITTETIPVPIGFATIEKQKAIEIDTNANNNGISPSKTNGKFHPIEENDAIKNETLLNDETNEFDSLINLPAPPPGCDEYKHLNEFGSIDNGNLDSLPPPPPPPEIAVGGPTNGES